MRSSIVVVGCLLGGLASAAAEPVACPGNPDALGTSRTLAVDPAALPRIGKIQYRNTLPLNDHEVVITFDDGPLPPYTDRILETLAAECVKVTYFLVGQMASAYPETVRRIYNAGHVIGTHSQSHPFHFDSMSEERIEREVTRGIASVTAALGERKALAPFFRIPGLARSGDVERYLASQSLAVWSADEVADDWHRGISAAQIVTKAIRRIESHDHRGVLLLHDIQPATALALPTLLKELKARGYRIVQAVPTGERPSLPERPAALVADASGGWPRVLPESAQTTEAAPTKVHRKPHHKRLARHHRVHGKATLHAKRIQNDGEVRRKASTDDRASDITAAIGTKKRKTKTATQHVGSRWR